MVRYNFELFEVLQEDHQTWLDGLLDAGDIAGINYGNFGT
jgi:hypothetical protein